MKNSTIDVFKNSSERLDLGNLIISVRTTFANRCEVVVGCPGLPNVIQTMSIGDAVLFETPNDGVLEVRALSMDLTQAEFLISQVSPRLGIAGGFVDDDPNNSPFTSRELEQLAESIKRIQLDLNRIPNVSPEQLDLIARKLDDIQAASQRLGRKDWINYVAGTLTSICVSAAFSPEASKALFKVVNSAFTWLFNNVLILLS